MADEKLVGISEAARQLGLHKSVLSRYVAANPDLNRSPFGPPKVLVSELREHREQTVNAAKSGNHAGLLQDEVEQGKPDPRAPSSTGLTAVRTTREEIRAEKDLLDLEREKRLTCSRDLVEDGALETGQLLLEKLAARNLDLADRAAVMSDPRDIRAMLDDADAKLLEELSDAAAQVISASAGGENTA